jgi:hypothetical protein
MDVKRFQNRARCVCETLMPPSQSLTDRRTGQKLYAPESSTGQKLYAPESSIPGN